MSPHPLAKQTGMSTRGLKGYIESGEYKAHQVNHDAYPSSLGLDFFKDCKRGFIDTIYDSSIEFIHNSLFCEWAYFYNLDDGQFEIWKGFQKVPQVGNPFGTEPDWFGYYPCRRIFQGDINSLTEEMFEEKDIVNKLLAIERQDKLSKLDIND